MVKYQINVANDVYPCFPSASFHVDVYKNTSGYLLALFMVVLRTLCLWVEEFVTAVLLFRIVYAMKCNAIYAIITSSWYLFKKKKNPLLLGNRKGKGRMHRHFINHPTLLLLRRAPIISHPFADSSQHLPEQTAKPTWISQALLYPSRQTSHHRAYA